MSINEVVERLTLAREAVRRGLETSRRPEELILKDLISQLDGETKGRAAA